MRSIILVLVLASPASSEGVFGHADALYWRAKSADFDNVFSYSSNLAIRPDWSPAFRAGVGYRHRSGWKASWTYTNFGADDSRAWSSVSYPGDSFSSYSDLDFQLHDFEVGQSFLLGEYFEVEVFGGFRWGQVDYSLVDRHRIPPGGPLISVDDYMRANSYTDSYGVRLGGRASCRLRGNLKLFGHGALSGMVSTTRSSGMTGSWSFFSWDRTDNHENLVLDASTGLAWQYGHLEVTAGYEWSSWQNSIQSRAVHFARRTDYEDLLLEGIFARVALGY